MRTAITHTLTYPDFVESLFLGSLELNILMHFLLGWSLRFVLLVGILFFRLHVDIVLPVIHYQLRGSANESLLTSSSSTAPGSHISSPSWLPPLAPSLPNQIRQKRFPRMNMSCGLVSCFLRITSSWVYLEFAVIVPTHLNPQHTTEWAKQFLDLVSVGELFCTLDFGWEALGINGTRVLTLDVAFKKRILCRLLFSLWLVLCFDSSRRADIAQLGLVFIDLKAIAGLLGRADEQRHVAVNEQLESFNELELGQADPCMPPSLSKVVIYA